MSIYAKAKKLLICIYSDLGGIFADFLKITIKLHLTVSTRKEQFYNLNF